MRILKDVLSELFSMFVSDARLTGAIVAVIAITVVLIDVAGLPTLVGGGFLLCGCLAVLVASVRQEAKRRESADFKDASL